MSKIIPDVEKGIIIKIPKLSNILKTGSELNYIQFWLEEAEEFLDIQVMSMKKLGFFKNRFWITVILNWLQDFVKFCSKFVLILSPYREW